MKTRSRYNITRRCLIFWCLFIGIGAVAGSVGMLTSPDGSNLGMQELLPYFQVLPFAEYLFSDYIFPGIALLCVNGIPNLIAAGLLFARRKSGIICGELFGLTLMAWIVIQFAIFPLNFMSTIYFIFGFIQLVTGFMTWVFYRQEKYSFNPADYSNIGTDKTKLVVWFSRMGYTKRAAYEAANFTGAVLYEVKSTEKTAGTLGFWWCGRFGMHGWDMPIEKVGVDLSAYEKVTVCSPVWVFRLSAPMRSFCREANGKIHCADCIITHFNPIKCQNVIAEIETLLGVTLENAQSICVQHGKIKKKYSLKSEENKNEA